MVGRVKPLLASWGDGYADVRWEENRRVRIAFQGKRLTECKSTATAGGHVRAFAGGGKALFSVSRPEDLPEVLDRARAAARALGAARARPIQLAPAAAPRGEFPVRPRQDPRQVPLQDKVELLSHYNSLALDVPGIVTTHAYYEEWSSVRTFLSSEGAEIRYELLLVNLGVRAVARKGQVIQATHIAFGGSEDFSRLVGREDELRERAELAVRLLSARPAQAGSFPVILDPDEAGLFIHEAFGHLSEADGLQYNPSFRARLTLGSEIAAPALSVADDPTLPGLPGSYPVDDEGMPGLRTQLIRDGVLTGRLHSRETAAEFSEPLSGNMRAVDAFYTPIVRMSNIFIEPGPHSFQEMLAAVEDGYYLVGAKGGQTSGDQFTFGAQWGWRIRGGRLAELVRDINMSGELFSTLKRIRMVGNDLRFSERGGCGKGGIGPMQLNPKSGKGAPHILISQVTIGGRG
ncbi:TldD/PmbA family protein [Candidatus Bipolaricaulota bacterium]|nr:TldD/PmbA family protein [Candidatus Bipolaricaulota bacterium]